MDVEVFGAMILRGIGQAELPIAGINRIGDSSSLLHVETADKSHFFVNIEKYEFEVDSDVKDIKERYKHNRIHSIYDAFSQTRECNKILMHNKFDIDWLYKKLNQKDYCRLESYILHYVIKNDELVFALGFKYAWSLFCECMGKGENEKFSRNVD